MSISNHVWGLSAACDRVWAQVSGIAPAKAGQRIFVVLQAFIDESYNNNGNFVLAGYVASAEVWASFTKEWEEMLPYADLKDKNGKYYFKMSEMATRNRLDRVEPFFHIIEKHVLYSVSCRIHQLELNRAKNRILVDGQKPNLDINKYLITFRILMDTFHKREFASLIGVDDITDFYFDDKTEKGAIIQGWDGYMANRPDNVRPRFGPTPRFEDDMDFLPLQAADFWAWWVRKWADEGKRDQLLDFGKWKAKRGYQRMRIWADEDDLVEAIMGWLVAEYPQYLISDRNISSSQVKPVEQ